MLLTRSKSHPWRLRANASVTAEAVGSSPVVPAHFFQQIVTLEIRTVNYRIVIDFRIAREPRTHLQEDT